MDNKNIGKMDMVIRDNKDSVSKEINNKNTDRELTKINKIKQNFSGFSTISLIFALAFTVLFYDTRVGINYFIFTIIMAALLVLAMKELSVPIKEATVFSYLGAILLGLSTMLTSNYTLQFLNFVGSVLLFNISLLYQIDQDWRWGLAKYSGKIFGLLFRSFASLGMPFSNSYHYFKNTKLLKNDRVRNVLVGLFLSIPLLFIVISLLSSADILFGQLTNNFFGAIISENIVIIVLMLIFGFLASYCIICAFADTYDMEEETRERGANSKKKADPTIGITIMVLLLGIYILFSSIQIIYLFANGLFVLPQEFTFAEYARRGFFELLAVTILNIILIIISLMYFTYNKVLNYLMTGITACSYIMVASAAYRMLLYLDAYHLTFSRLLVLLFLIIDTFILAGVIISIYRRSFPLFRYCVLVTSLCYIPFSLARPDCFIAKYHIQHTDKLEWEDIYYLTDQLSIDAAPVVLPLLEERADYQEIKEEYKDRILDEVTKRDIRAFNHSIYRAAKILRRR